MRLHALAVGVFAGFVLLAGCSEQSTPAASAEPAVAAKSSPARMVAATDRIGDAQDRGSVVEIGAQSASLHRGPESWTPVKVSEEHAIQAIGSGELVVRLPGRPPMRIAHVRTATQEDGNWTFVGRQAGAKIGQETILTFGEDAVFGRIDNGTSEPLRIVTERGKTYLVETDPRLAAQRDARAPQDDDFVDAAQVLESQQGLAALAMQHASATAGKRASSAQAESLTPNGSAITILLGYTDGLAVRLGSDAAAQTRMAFIVQVANNVLTNTGVDAELQLAGTQRVTWSDTSTNRSALFALSGLQCSNGSGGALPDGGVSCVITGQPAELMPLIGLREQVDADLVALVRDQASTSNTCGTAWLLGGGQSETNVNSAELAMAVVNDGNGCRDETLAHEIAHNFGLQHDRQTAQQTDDTNNDGNPLDPEEFGRFPYSFGYSTDTTNGNFHTVEAVRRAGQAGVLVYSNPNIMVCTGNRACGVAEEADSARALAQTLPIVASFRLTLAPKRGFDLNTDARTDIAWFNGSLVCAWYMNGPTPANNCLFSAPAATRVLQAADMTGDGRDDLLLDDGANITLWTQTADGSYTSSHVAAYGAGWVPFGIGDYNGDGKADLGWEANGTYFCPWTMDGATIVASRCFLSQGPSYTLLSTNDFNGDGFSDLLYGNGTNLNMWLNQRNGLYAIRQIATYDAQWMPQNIGDINDDGNADIGWSNGQYLCAWHMGGYMLAGTSCYGGVPANGTVRRAGDFDGNGLNDLLWDTGSNLTLWQKQGAYFSPANVSDYAAPWKPY